MRILAILLLFTLPASADIIPRHQRPARITCTVVRDFVAMVGKEEAERMARSTGASDAKIEAARRCLRG
jgi:hypothetical protein